MNKKYIVKLTSTERKQLKEIIAKGKAAGIQNQTCQYFIKS